MVDLVAEECGLELSGFLTDVDLELFFDVTQGYREMGFTAKGWDDPWFWVGDIVPIDK